MKQIAIFLSPVLILTLFSCTNNKAPNNSLVEKTEEVITIDGSSTVFPILKNAAEIYKQEFLHQHGEMEIVTKFSGTSKGFEKLISGEADIIGASRPINMKEDRACRATDLEYVELLIGYDGIVIATNSKNNWVTSITKSELKKLWAPESQRRINSWKEVNAKWPDLPVHLYGAGINSGTYDYFTEVIVGAVRQSRTDFTSSEDDNYLVHKVSSDSLALGFFGYHYYIKNDHILKALKVDNEDGKGLVEPNDSTIKNGSYKPLSRPLFVYVSKESLNKENVKKFLVYFADHLAGFVQTSEYISPNSQQLATIKEKLNEHTTGSDYIKIVQ